MTIEEFIKETFKPTQYDFCMRPQIICNDGFKMSVQGSSGHYCKPRRNIDYYLEMEIGFPNLEEELILEYAEEPNSPTQTVYGYVPIGIIQLVINKHGGINELETFEQKTS